MMRTGVIGLGAMGQHHARVYSELPCKLAGVADADGNRAREIGEKYGVPYFSDYRELLGKVDAVSVAVPTVAHHAVALEFLRRGVHCLVEKPITFDLAQAEEMVETANRNGVNLAVGHIERFNPAVSALKKVMAGGLLGRVLVISTKRMSPSVPRIRDVGVVMDLATHDIGVVRHLAGRDPERVFAKVGSLNHAREDYAVILLDFGETAACVEVNWFSPEKVRTLVATGSERTAYLDYAQQTLKIQDKNGSEMVPVEKQEPLKLELADFLASVAEKRRPAVDGNEGKAVLDISINSCRAFRQPAFSTVPVPAH